MPKLGIAPGHSRKRPGAHGASGLQEHEVNHDIAIRLLRVAKAAGWEALITNLVTEHVSPGRQAQICNAADCHYLVSIHCNAGPPSAKGIEIFYDDQHEIYRSFAKAVLDELAKVHNVIRPNPIKPDHMSQHKDLSVLSQARMPAILVELGFITNPDEEKMLADPKSREVLALALFQGVRRYHETLRTGTTAGSKETA